MANELLNLKEGGGAVADTHGDYIIPTDGFLADTKYVWQETTPSALPAYNAAWLPSQAVKATYAAPLLPAQSVLIPTSLVTSLSASETGVKLFDLSGSATFSNGVYLGRGGAYVQASILPTRSNNYRWRTRSTSATNNNWRSVCWSPERNRFVAVADTGTGDRVMTSEDGITWTSRTSAADDAWISVCWSPELNRFVAVAQSGAGNQVMTCN